MTIEEFFNLTTIQLNNLENLDLSRNRFSSLNLNNFYNFCVKLSAAPKLKILNLNCSDIGLLSLEHVNILQNTLQQCSNLQIIELECNALYNLNNLQIKELFLGLSKCYKLHTITLSNNIFNKLSQEILLDIFNAILQCKNLQSLYLSQNEFLTLNRDLFLSLINILTQHPNLTTLGLNYNNFDNISDNSFEKIFNKLIQIPKLEKLYLIDSVGIISEQRWGLLQQAQLNKHNTENKLIQAQAKTFLLCWNKFKQSDPKPADQPLGWLPEELIIQTLYNAGNLRYNNGEIALQKKYLTVKLNHLM